jgi:hypothetical protein
MEKDKKMGLKIGGEKGKNKCFQNCDWEEGQR